MADKKRNAVRRLSAHFARFAVLAVSVVALAGCAADAISREPGGASVTTSASDSTSSVVKIGEWIAHYDAATTNFTLTPVTHRDGEGPGALSTAGYQQLTTGAGYTISAATTAGTIGPSLAFPSCASTQLCANVAMTNATTTHSMFNTWIQVMQIGSTSVTVANSDALNTSYPLYTGTTWGDYFYGDLPATSGSATKEWIFNVGSPATSFNLSVAAYAVIERASYSGNGATTTGTPNYVNACALAGSTTILQSKSTPTASAAIPMPFPFVFNDAIFGNGLTPTFDNSLVVTSDGVVGLGSVLTNHVTLPNNSGNFDYSLFPFWNQNLHTSASGICYGTSGSFPNRKFVIEWRDATIGASGDDMNFEVILNETTDEIDYVYTKWNKSGSCTPNGASRGNTATIGAQGISGTATSSVLIEFNTSYLPLTSSCTKEYTVKITGVLQ
ncbi:MAG: hypothetical protein ACHREM_16855 [Polyangiales bacterium]